MTCRPFQNTIGFILVLIGLAPAYSQYPARPVRIVVPTSTGSGTDFTTRLLAPLLTERLGQQVVVDNRAGAAGMIGTESVAKSAPDGHTLLMAVPALATNPSLFKRVPYDAARAFAPITQAVNQPLLLVVHPSLPVRSVKDLIAMAKSRPDDIAFASAGPGSAPHLTMELFLQTTGARMLHVPYKGPAPAVIDLIAGRVSVMAIGSVAILPHVRSGKVRAIGITSGGRSTSLPDLPTVAEAGVPGYEAVSWWGLLAPAGTPQDIIVRLHKEATAVLQTREIRERLAREGAEVVAGSPEAFAAHIRAETVKWAKVARSAGIQPE